MGDLGQEFHKWLQYVIAAYVIFVMNMRSVLEIEIDYLIFSRHKTNRYEYTNRNQRCEPPGCGQ